jgi:hypothetical protein
MIDDGIEKRLLAAIENSTPKPERYPEKKGRHFVAGKQFETEAEADQYAKDNGLIVYHTWRARMKGTWVSHKRTDQNEPNFTYGHKRPKKTTPTK